MSLWTMFIKNPVVIYIERGEEEAVEIFKDFFGENFSEDFIWCQTGEPPTKGSKKTTIILGVEEINQWMKI